jgi:UDP-N-acetylglucosamine:LPS N-acetylglucosamine transferase
MKRRKVLIIIINHAGLGHLNRGLVLAQSLWSSAPTIDLFLLVNSDLAERFLAESPFPYWNIPPSPWTGEIPITRKLTRESIRVVQQYIGDSTPDLLIYDTNFIAELIPEAAAQKIKQVWVVRDRKEDVLRAWFRNPVLSYFDLLLVPHEPAEFPASLIPEALRPKTLFTGPLVREPVSVDRDALYRQYGIKEGAFVVLFSAGGGNENSDTLQFLEMVRLGCRELTQQYPHISCIVLAGMYHQRAIDFSDWGERVRVVPFERHILCLMQRTDIFISEAGYNTCYERILTQSPGILVPVRTTLDDQYRRAAYWEQQGGFIVLRNFSASHLVEQVGRLYEQREELAAMKKRLQTIKMRVGNAQAAQVVLELLER